MTISTLRFSRCTQNVTVSLSPPENDPQSWPVSSPSARAVLAVQACRKPWRVSSLVTHSSGLDRRLAVDNQFQGKVLGRSCSPMLASKYPKPAGAAVAGIIVDAKINKLFRFTSTLGLFRSGTSRQTLLPASVFHQSNSQPRKITRNIQENTCMMSLSWVPEARHCLARLVSGDPASMNAMNPDRFHRALRLC